jgi:hypothetical protein
MITPKEIRQKAERKYLDFLRATVNGEPFFPLAIRFRKARADDDYLALRDWVGELLAGSKRERGFGYRVELEERERSGVTAVNPCPPVSLSTAKLTICD